MDHITNDTSLIGTCDVIPVGGRNERFPDVKITFFKTSYLEICNMHEAVQLLYIRYGLNCVIEQFSILVFKCCTRATTPKLLENHKKG